MNCTIKIALVGAGYWGKNLARNLSELNSLHSICDLNPDAAETIASQYGVPILSFQEVLRDETLDAVMIATKASSHFTLSEMALKAGKHIFIEKPITTNLKDAFELAKLARNMKKQIMVGHLLQYHPAFIKLKDLVHQNTLGQIKYIYANRLDFGKFYPGENVILNLASHDISMILSLMKSPPISVTISEDKPTTDSAIINLSFPNQTQAHVFISRLNPFKEHKLVVVGNKMMAVFDDTEPNWNKKLCLYPYKVQTYQQVIEASKEPGQFVEIEKSEPLRIECMHFIECVSANKTPRTDIQEAIKVMEVLCKTQPLNNSSIFVGN